MNVDRIYRGDDGSLVSFRQVGAKVYGFSENVQHQTATVLVGTLNGTRIEGEWYDVPKGHREERGEFRFDVSVARSSGPAATRSGRTA